MSKHLSADNRIYAWISSQVSLTAYGNNVFSELQKLILKWASHPERNVERIPDSAFDGEPFEVDLQNSEYVAAIKLESPKYWAFQLSERLKDPNRIWTTEVGIAEKQPNEVVFGCRLICFSQLGSQDTIPRSIPRFVREVAFEHKAMLDGRPTSDKPWIIDNEEEVNRLVQFIKSTDRCHPIVVFSLPEHSSDLNETIIPTDFFIKRTAGYAHTTIITSDASFILTDRLGRDFSVYRQAVRTYNPQFELESDRPTDHPVATAVRIQAWNDTEESNFGEFLVQQVLRLKRPRKVLETEQPSFRQIKRLAVKESRDNAEKAGRSDPEIVELYEEELAATKKEAEEYKERLSTTEDDLYKTEKEVERLKGTRDHLRQRIEKLQEQLSNIGQAAVPEIPNSLENFENWCQENLSDDKVTLHPRALSGVKKSIYENTTLIYEALLLLNDFYVPMRRKGGSELRKLFENKCRELGITQSLTGKKTRAGEYQDTYFINYSSKRYFLDNHLKKGDDRNERRCFRLYFFYQSEEQKVVVGWLPSHLRTRIT